MTDRFKDALDDFKSENCTLIVYSNHHDIIVEALTLATEAEQLRKENEKLTRENEVFSERHKAWESCVYAVGLPMFKSIRDTEYGDSVPPIPVVNKVTDLLD